MLEPKVFITLDAEGESLIINGSLMLLRKFVAVLWGEQESGDLLTSAVLDAAADDVVD